MAQTNSADMSVFEKVEREHAEYMERTQARHADDFPAKAELEGQIEAAQADNDRYVAKYYSTIAEIAKEEPKLTALREKAVKAQAALGNQQNTIQLLRNQAESLLRYAAKAAQDKEAYEAQLANKDYARYRKQVS